jgi:hypothetical protein
MRYVENEGAAALSAAIQEILRVFSKVIMKSYTSADKL